MTLIRKIKFLLGLNKQVSDDEVISRFILSKNKIKNSTNEIRYNAFIPPKKIPDEISVYRISGINENEIWDIGKNKVAPPGKKIYGRGDSQVINIHNITFMVKQRLQNLLVLTDKKPHPLHANIVNLNTDDAKRKEIALRLSKVFSLVRINE